MPRLVFRHSIITTPHSATTVPIDLHTSVSLHTLTEHDLQPFHYEEPADLIWLFNHLLQVATAVLWSQQSVFTELGFGSEKRTDVKTILFTHDCCHKCDMFRSLHSCYRAAS